MSSVTRQTGLTMVELLVALAVGLFLTAGIIQLMANSNQASRSVNASSFVQENARFALATLAHDIRMAGFLGCRSGNDGSVSLISSSAAFDADAPADDAGRPIALRGLAPDEDPTWSLGSVQRVPGNDLIEIFSAQGTGTTLSANLASAEAQLMLAGNPDGLKTGDVAVITDCQDASIFSVTGITGTMVEHTGVGRPYPEGARVFPLLANAYVVGTRANSPCAEQSCLYKVPLGRRNVSGGVIAAQDLVVVEELKLRYGQSAGGGVDYRTADDVTDWSQVSTVRIGLLVGSDSDVTSSSQKYVFSDPADENLAGDPTITEAADRRLRIPYWATVTLRNSLP
jgi:type IV pilus assembly protein PilW